MSPEAENQDPEADEPESILTPDVLPDVYRSHADALRSEIEAFAEDIERDGKPSSRRLGSVRTELRELDSLVEEPGAKLCDDAEPWEHIDEYYLPKQ